MTHEEYQAIIPAYAVEATDEEEARLLVRHLRHCRKCRAMLASYRALSDDLLYTVDPVFAPLGLSGRLQRGVGYAQLAEGGLGQVTVSGQIGTAPGSAWDRVRAVLVWPIIVLALLSLLLTNVYWFDRVNRLEEQVAGQQMFAAQVPSEPVATLYGTAGSAEGIVYRGSEGNRALLCVYDMPELPAGKAYQVWLIQDGHRDSGGLFQVTTGGYGILMLDLPRPLAEYDSLGITVEPEGGSAGPTSPRVIGGSL